MEVREGGEKGGRDGGREGGREGKEEEKEGEGGRGRGNVFYQLRNRYSKVATVV